MTAGQTLCAVDLGTSAIRAAMLTDKGVVTARRSRRRSGVSATTFGADALVDDTFRVLRELTSVADPDAVAAVGLSGHVGTIFVDGSHSPIGAASMWSDNRGADLTQSIMLEAAVARTIGRQLPAAGSLALAMWLRRCEPERHRAIRWVLAPKDYVSLRLTGAARTDLTSAAYSLAFDITRLLWSSELLATAGLSAEQLPEPATSSDIIGVVTADAAAATGLRAGTPVAAGGPDGTLGAATVIGNSTHVIMDVAGTTDVLFRVSGTLPERVPGVVINPYVTRDTWSYGGPTGLTGGAVEYIARLLGYDGAADALREVAQRGEPSSSRLAKPFVMPYLSGSRFPTWDHSELGGIVGLRAEHSRIDLFLGALEGAAFAVREGADLIASERDIPIAFAGGAARSSYLAQLRADILNRTLLVCDDPDVSLRGAALTAALATGIHSSFEAAVAAMKPTLTRYELRRSWSTSFSSRYESWRELRERIRDRAAP